MEVNVCREKQMCIISCANTMTHGATSLKKMVLSPIGNCAVQHRAAIHLLANNDPFCTDEQQGHTAVMCRLVAD
jgi:hypothetical protein